MAGPAITIDTVGETFTDDMDSYGFVFTLRAPETVQALGVYDDGGGPLPSDASVGLWDNNGNLLASVTIPAGSSATLIGGFLYAAITPTNLLANTAYVVGAYSTDDPITSFNTGANTGTATLDSNIVSIYDREGFSFSPSLHYPDATLQDPGAWLGANFTTDAVASIADAVASPEPASIAILGAGLVGLASRHRRKIAS